MTLNDLRAALVVLGDADRPLAVTLAGAIGEIEAVIPSLDPRGIILRCVEAEEVEDDTPTPVTVPEWSKP